MPNLLIFCLLLATSLFASSKYESALLYLDGSIGGIKETIIVPRCPYDRCKGDMKVEKLKKDRKTAYHFLKESIIHEPENANSAANKAIDILLKEMNYKSKKYEDLLLKRINKELGINSKEEYDKDMRDFLFVLSKSSIREEKCKSGYLLFTAYKNGYFGLKINNSTAENFRAVSLENCEKDSFNYLMLRRK